MGRKPLTPEERRERAKLYARKWRKENPEKSRETVRRYHEKNLEKHRKRAYAWRKRNREKVNVHEAVAEALRKGRIKKPEVCENCGANGRLEGHHLDYSKRLEVIWLCPVCHSGIHR